jgi:hypothetical protein
MPTFCQVREDAGCDTSLIGGEGEEGLGAGERHGDHEHRQPVLATGVLGQRWLGMLRLQVWLGLSS